MAMPKSDKKVVSIATHRGPVELQQRIHDFIDNAGPEILAKIAKASMELNGETRTPKEGNRNLMGFYDYAVSLVLSNLEKETTPRFGVRIEEDVHEIMAKNRAAYAADPTAWENLTAIGSTLLRAKGHNPVSIARWLTINQKMIDAHHAEIGITDPLNHNRKAGKARSLRK